MLQEENKNVKEAEDGGMSLEEIFRAIHPISDAALGMIRDKVRIMKIKKGDKLIEEGKVCTNVYFIRRGILRNYANNNGEEDTRWFACAGDHIASMYSLSQNSAAIASVDALTDGEAYVMSSEEVHRCIRESHEWAEWVSYFFIDGLYVLERRYTFLGRGDAYTRYVNFLNMRPLSMTNEIPLKYIASYLGITPQTLSNLRRQVGKREPEFLQFLNIVQKNITKRLIYV